MNYMTETHFMHRVGWLRAAVLGANDGILSTTSIAIGVAAATPHRSAIILAALAGLTAGAMSMAAGEYVSVSSQADSEKSDMEREKNELKTMPDAELRELAGIYEERGLSKELAHEVAVQLTAHNALEAHMRDELGITDTLTARPLQAALSSFASFIAGAFLPLLVAIFAPVTHMVYYQYVLSILFLVVLGSVAAKTGGSSVPKAIGRIAFWGTIAMVATALVGHLFGVNAG
ncbi:MAG: VIT family protein [Petrimonas sp.]|nr:VIT family protein [Petrimonas sp.]